MSSRGPKARNTHEPPTGCPRPVRPLPGIWSCAGHPGAELPLHILGARVQHCGRQSSQTPSLVSFYRDHPGSLGQYKDHPHVSVEFSHGYNPQQQQKQMTLTHISRGAKSGVLDSGHALHLLFSVETACGRRQRKEAGGGTRVGKPGASQGGLVTSPVLPSLNNVMQDLPRQELGHTAPRSCRHLTPGTRSLRPQLLPLHGVCCIPRPHGPPAVTALESWLLVPLIL